MKKSRVFAGLFLSLSLAFTSFLPVAARESGQDVRENIRAEAESTQSARRTPTDFEADLSTAFKAQSAVFQSAAVNTALTAEWPSFRGNERNNGVISFQTPENGDEAALKWEYKTAAESYGYPTSPSDILIVDDNIYVAESDKLTVLDKNGEVVKQATLSHAIGYTARLAYGDGMIFVPIDNGQIEALTAGDLQFLWVSDASEGKQTISALTYSDGYLYTAITNANWTSTSDGEFLCLDAGTGAKVWNYQPASEGYYWSGAVVVGNAVIVGGDDGVLTSLNAGDGTLISTVSTGARIRSAIMYDADSGSVFFTTYDGKLHKVKVDSAGTLGADENVVFSAGSTSTPAIIQGKVFVGGYNEDYSGNLSVIDAEAMTVLESASAPANVQSSPLVTTGYDGRLYAYATSNTTPGALYVYEYGAGQTELTAIYTPESAAQNYCMYSPVADSDGTVYYANDSGYLFAVGAAESQEAAPGEEKSDNGSGGGQSDENNGSEQSEIPEKLPGYGTATDKKTDDPSTGDTASLSFQLLVLLAAGGVIVFCIRRKPEIH